MVQTIDPIDGNNETEGDGGIDIQRTHVGVVDAIKPKVGNETVELTTTTIDETRRFGIEMIVEKQTKE